MDRWSLWLFYVSIGASAILLLRFIRNDLYRTYRFLFGYFAAVLSSSLILTRIPYGTDAYMHSYVAAEVVYHVLAIFVVLEMYRIALAGHDGIAKFGRTGILTATVLALVVAAVISLLDRNLPAGQSANVHRFVTLQHSGDLMVVVFLILIGIFITWFPIKMSTNTFLSIAGFSIIFFVRAGMLLAINILPLKSLATANNAAMILETVMMLAWAV